MNAVTSREPPQSSSAGLPALGQLGLFVALGGRWSRLDFSIVNVALPALSVAMGVSTTTADGSSPHTR